jgi:hypothetical protein
MMMATSIISAAAGAIAVAGLANVPAWLCVAIGVVTALIGIALLARFRSPVGRLSVTAVLAMAGILVASGTIEVLVLAVPLSSLSTGAARLATATALATSLASVTLAGREAIVSGMFDQAPEPPPARSI